MTMDIGKYKNFNFRTIQKGDEQTVRSIIFDILQDYELTLDIEGVDHDLFNIVEHYKSGLFAVVEDSETEKIVGSFALFPLNSEQIELRKMYHLKECRGKGVGKWIIEFCIQKAKDLGYSTITLESASVLKEALQLYLSKGFTRVTIPNHTERCDVVMEYDLNG